MAPKAQVLSVCRRIADVAERAANQTIDRMGYEHIPELRAIIRRGEREHRAFGARLLGKRPARGLTIRETEDLFIAICLASAARANPEGGATLASVDGMRDDYLLAARMWEHQAFRTRFLGLLNEGLPEWGGAAPDPDGTMGWARWVGENADYARFQP